MPETAHKHTNRLINETSPYLQQHAHNPVDWHPWGTEALERAKSEGKPILLSIGYSACHWCHVMERESFENLEIADIMNRHFINIKVDREERPDLDQIYQVAVQMFQGRAGGWPLTMFLTPDGEPFYGGTYFPPQDRYNLPGFPKVLSAAAEAFEKRPQDIRKTTSQILNGLSLIAKHQASEESLSLDAVKGAAESLMRYIEPVYGGFGGAPKFPNTQGLSLLLRYHRISGNTDAMNHVTHTLIRMAEGGIYDHLGGGFHRYSVDERWLVPHFEKMSYDNSQLIRLYLEAYQATGNELFKRISVETLAYVQREMQFPEGGFYSTQDADSEGEEGKFFTWTPEEVTAVIGEEAGRIFCRYYDVSPNGNFEGKNILHTDLPLEGVAREFDQGREEIASLLRGARAKLFDAREARIKPFRDEKILTSWNALMISAAVAGYNVLGTSSYMEMARKATDFVLTHLFKEDRLLCVYKDGTAKLNAYLDDYAYLIAALLDLYEATFEPLYLEQANHLTAIMIEQFWDDGDEGGGFFFTGKDHETLISRSKSGFDQSIPSGNAVAAMDLLRLYYLKDSGEYLEKAERILRLFYKPMQENPFGYSSLVSALHFYLETPKQIVLVGDKKSPEARELIRRIHSLYLPNKTLACVDPDRPSGDRLTSVVLGQDGGDRRVKVYVCHRFTCSLPATDWESLRKQLAPQDPPNA